MGGRELDQHVLTGANVTAGQARAAAVHIADRIAAEHPDPRDDFMPKLAGRQLAHDPTVRADVLELLDAIGYPRKEQQ
ncbi:hypothetical protein [Streptomyces sp. NBC_01373]|uniref:hypothetical protein n=1 Tax=Streptomyces sp. NBC_01373 TaxID=2903843 RepID=UPI00225007E4|nr:hypothetical protein [Streptomyces sp. NBC_01373]MCX4697054.1 hypothetical protein [Streptomyces sp. NBC_01373]MCX4707021.1 hypothetical protein [Streptomyces sp. NBC_01373]